MRDIYYAGGLTEHYTYDEYNQLTELKTNKISIYTYEYDAEGDRISQKAETKDRFEYGSKYVDTWYDDLSQMDIEEIEDMLQSMDSHTAFDNLRHSIKHRGLCKGNFGQNNVNDAEYGTPSRIDNYITNNFNYFICLLDRGGSFFLDFYDLGDEPYKIYQQLKMRQTKRN